MCEGSTVRMWKEVDTISLASLVFFPAVGYRSHPRVGPPSPGKDAKGPPAGLCGPFHH